MSFKSGFESRERESQFNISFSYHNDTPYYVKQCMIECS